MGVMKNKIVFMMRMHVLWLGSQLLSNSPKRIWDALISLLLPDEKHEQEDVQVV